MPVIAADDRDAYPGEAARGGAAGRMPQGEHNIFSGLLTYTSTNRNRMPPFAMSTYDGNVGMSGSWGGVEQTSDGDTPRRARSPARAWSR